MTPDTLEYTYKNFVTCLKSHSIKPPTRTEFKEALGFLIFGAPVSADSKEVSDYINKHYLDIMQGKDSPLKRFFEETEEAE